MSSGIAFKPFISADTSKLADYLINSINDATVNSGLSKSDVIAWLINFANDNKEIILELSTTRPDFESIKQQFFARLSQLDTWKDIVQAGGGETILEFVSAIGSLGQAGIIVALQENNLDTAALTSSVYVLMRMLGVHIRRKVPAHVQVTFTNSNPGNIVIPSFSQFVISGENYFNKESIVFNPSSNQSTAILYQGDVSVETFLSNGAPYQRLEIGENLYNIADSDVYCFTPGNNQWVRIEDGLWNYDGTDRVFYENTTPEGNVEILLGNDMYGSIPPVNEVLNFIYATTKGSSSNSTKMNLPVTVTYINSYVPDRIRRNTNEEVEAAKTIIFASITGRTITPIEGGDDEKDKEHYRAVGPFLFSGKKGLIRKKDHYASALEFPGIADVLFQNQKDISPYNRNLINVVYVTPLMKTGRLMTNTEWLSFVEYLTERQIWRVDWVLYQPTEIPVNIKAVLYATLDSNITNMKSYAEFKVRELFNIGRNTLGRSLELTDISGALKLTYYGMKVDYVDLQDPMISLPVNKTDFLKLRNVQIDVEFSSRNHGNFIPSRPEDSIPLI